MEEIKKLTEEELNEAIMKFSLDGIDLARKMQENQNIKQAIFCITVNETNNNARVAPIACGDSRVMVAILCQVALQDDWIKEVFLATHKLINDGIKMPTIKVDLDDKD